VTWLLVAVVFAVLVVFWKLLELTFDLIGKWQRGMAPPVQPSAEDGGKRVEGKVI